MLEISQTCVAAGCFPGDAPGFPVRIPAPGSYRLTSDLDVTGEPIPQDVTAIEIPFTSNVRIGLNSYSIIVGNIARGNGAEGIKVTASIVRGNAADENGAAGIDALGGSTVIGNRASFNTGAGIQLIGGSGYTDNVVTKNTGGTIVGGVEMGTNVCNTDTTCP